MTSEEYVVQRIQEVEKKLEGKEELVDTQQKTIASLNAKLDSLKSFIQSLNPRLTTYESLYFDSIYDDIKREYSINLLKEAGIAVKEAGEKDE